MYSLLAYIVQVNILLVIVYIGYYVLLRKLTFHRLNRGYFLAGVVFAFVYPFLDIQSLFRQHIEPVGEWMAYLPDFYVQQVEESAYTLENAIYSGIAVVGLWFAIRLCLQLLSLLRIHLHSRKAIWKTYWYQHVLFPIVPFSFLNKIYLHKEQHQEPELYDIFEHEDIHVKGLHSMDILMFEILLIVCWYNPFVWFMRRAVRQNLEYLTDQQVLNKGVDRQTYQYSLLNVSKQGVSLGLSNQFNFKFLKKRIMMMNKKKSSKLELSKYAFLLPVIIFSAGAFTISKADGKIVEVVDVVKDIRLDTFTKESDRRIKSDSDSGESIQHVAYTTIVEKPAVPERENTLSSNGVKKDPIFIVDDKRMLSGYELDELNPNEIASIHVWKGMKAIAKYGDEAANGAVEIITKAKAKQDSLRKREPSEDRVTDTLSVTIRYDDKMTSEKGAAKSIRSVQVREVEKNPVDTTNRPSLTLRGLNAGAEPMYVIDGKIQPEGRYAIDDLDPNQIESIEVLKRESATSLYGDKGKNGVLLIKTKNNGDNDERLRVWGFQTPKPLKNPGYVVDGTMVSKEEYVKIAESQKKSIVTLSKKEADNYFKFYNQPIDLGTHDGVVMVTTK